MRDLRVHARRIASLALHIGVVVALGLRASALASHVSRPPLLPVGFNDPRECFRDDDGEWICGAMEYRGPFRAE